jgi:hypothetical protein
MTTGRNIEEDRQNTAALILISSAGVEYQGDTPNWLGHTKGAAKIDVQLLWGTTMSQMELCRRAVSEHLRHLKKHHGLTAVEINGVHRLAVLPL